MLTDKRSADTVDRRFLFGQVRLILLRVITLLHRRDYFTTNKLSSIPLFSYFAFYGYFTRCRHIYDFRLARQRRPDRAVYVPRHRRSLETEEKTSKNPNTSHTNPPVTLNEDPNMNNNSKLQDACCIRESIGGSSSDNKISEGSMEVKDNQLPTETLKNMVPSYSGEVSGNETHSNIERRLSKEELKEDIPILSEQKETIVTSVPSENITNFNLLKSPDNIINEIDDKQVETSQPTVEENQSVAEHLSSNDEINHENRWLVEQDVASKSVTSDVLTISDDVTKRSKHSEQVPEILTSPEKKVKKIERQKSKPAPPPSPPLKINRDECDWDSLFDDNGDCLDPTLVEEVNILYILYVVITWSPFCYVKLIDYLSFYFSLRRR